MEGSIPRTTFQTLGGPTAKQTAEVVSYHFKPLLRKIKIPIKDGLSVTICHQLLKFVKLISSKTMGYRLLKTIGTKATITTTKAVRCSPPYIPVLPPYNFPNLNKLGCNFLPWQPVLDVFQTLPSPWALPRMKAEEKRSIALAILGLVEVFGLVLGL